MKLAKRVRVVLALLVVFHALILFAGFFAPYDYVSQDRELPYAPPTLIHFVGPRGKVHVRPFVYGWKWKQGGSGGYEEDRGAIYPVRFFVQGAPYKVAGLFTSRRHLFGVANPGRIFLLGTDGYGRDQFSRFLYGGRISLLAGLLAAGLTVLLGMLIGGAAGYYGGWTDEAFMHVAELFLALPWLYLLFAVRAALPLHVSPSQTFLLLVGVIGIVSWARPARLIRGVVLSAKERNFVSAARGFGAGGRYILWRHLLPQTRGVALTQLALLVPQYILAEVTLTFLGLGIGEPTPSWGSLLSCLQQYYVIASYWWMFLPALLLIPLFVGYYALANAMQERPKSLSL